MSYTWFWTLSCSIFLAAVTGWARFRRIAPAFYPFILFIWIGVLNEIISIVLLRFGYSDRINNNIYVLLESVLLISQLVKWNGLGRYRSIAPVIFALVCIAWLFENVFIFRIHHVSSYFRLLYSFLIVLLAIRVTTNLILTETSFILKNPVILICLGLIIYFTFKVLVEVFWLYGLSGSSRFRVNIYSIMIWINFATNLIYALAVLWIPPKQRFSMQY
jgi:hypothetical protein